MAIIVNEEETESSGVVFSKKVFSDTKNYRAKKRYAKPFGVWGI